jgi:hypothetical protein
MALEDIVEDVRDYFYENGNTDLQVEIGESEFSIFLDLPNTSNYEYHINELEKFFRVSDDHDIEDFDIDGDYEGIITAVYGV